MMMYAVSNGGSSARMIGSEADILPGEVLWIGELPGDPGDEFATGLVLDSGAVRVRSATELLALARSQAETRLRSACRAAILAGSVSSALGAPYTYPTELTDQLNMSAQCLRATLNPTGEPYYFACSDAAGVWVRRPHTAAEIIAAGLDMGVHVSAQQARLADRLAAVSESVDPESVAW